MKRKTKIQTEESNGNLHINLRGNITPQVAAQLTLVMEKMYCGCGKIIVNTSEVTSIAAQSKYAVRKLMCLLDSPKSNIFYHGKSAYAICHDEEKVIQYSKANTLQNLWHGEGDELFQHEGDNLAQFDFMRDEHSCLNRYQIT